MLREAAVAVTGTGIEVIVVYPPAKLLIKVTVTRRYEAELNSQ